MDDKALLVILPELPLVEVDIEEPPNVRDFVLPPPPPNMTRFLTGEASFSPFLEEVEEAEVRGGEGESAKIGKIAPFLRI